MREGRYTKQKLISKLVLVDNFFVFFNSLKRMPRPGLFLYFVFLPFSSYLCPYRPSWLSDGKRLLVSFVLISRSDIRTLNRLLRGQRVFFLIGEWGVVGGVGGSCKKLPPNKLRLNQRSIVSFHAADHQITKTTRLLPTYLKAVQQHCEAWVPSRID